MHTYMHTYIYVHRSIINIIIYIYIYVCMDTVFSGLGTGLAGDHNVPPSTMDSLPTASSDFNKSQRTLKEAVAKQLEAESQL